MLLLQPTPPLGALRQSFDSGEICAAQSNYMKRITVATVNASGRQAASFTRVAAAVGWKVRAHMQDCISIVAQDISSLDNVTVIEGFLGNQAVIDKLFSEPVDVAFINTTHWGDEFAIGKAIVNAAIRAGVKHLIYSSMPDHSSFGYGWKALPLWANKFKVEKYIQSTGIPATFIYCGTYHNNFTSLPYPLFNMALQDDESFEWQAPFHPDVPIPWLDAEHDVGPVVLQLFKDGPARWGGQKIPIAFEYLTPRQVCAAFSRALNRPVEYVQGPIDIKIRIPQGYRDHLAILEEVLGDKQAPYFGPDLEPNCTAIAIELWEGNRSMEEYAREVFPVEEQANGQKWMEEGDEPSDDVPLDFTALRF
ncbi:NmrA-domain-containing protein [Microthyrium microscopicum]|uniref:NmrA-domain-containing protein n=1 Tax=Microthyrium microscopicum TaxID=703497 RepID=A0A6A6UQA4_9PEZI|nr:NmrA-domain-containing protein [Microthyrium microscopicum]